MNAESSTFADRFCEAIQRCGTPLVVGLDPRVDQLPESLTPKHDADRGAIADCFGQFCRGVIDVVAERVPAVKPNTAFFEALGPSGLHALSQIDQYAQRRGLLVILDGKRSDIGSTAEAYAQAYLTPDNPWHADALTVNPYLGGDALLPMIESAHESGCGLFVLVKTSNAGSGDIQDLSTPSGTVYQKIADQIEEWNRSRLGRFQYGCCGAVVGATYPEQLLELRQRMPHAILLIPGVGAQGASPSDVSAAFDPAGLGAAVNCSRSIIFAYRRREFAACSHWQAAVEQATEEMIAQLEAI